MTSADSKLLNKISTELKHLSLKRQQLLERKKIKCIFQELSSRVEFEQTEEAASCHREIDSIDEKLRQLAETKAKLQKSRDKIINNKEVSFTSSQEMVPDVPTPDLNIYYIGAPPTIPAPTVILERENLPPWPCRTQCPECKQFILTETFSSVSSVTWLVCFMTAMIGCVAGCCLIPFCLNRFKSATHRCPKCRTSIHTVKRL